MRFGRCPVGLRRSVAAAVGVAVVALAAPITAEAATDCEFVEGANVLFVKMHAAEDVALLQTSGTTITVAGSSGAVSCSGGTPTTANTGDINVFDESGSGGTTLAVHNSQTLAEPINIHYFGGGGEDMVQVASDPAQQALLIAGKTGINMNGAGGQDIEFIDVPERIELIGSFLSDSLSARGTGGTGGVLEGPFVLMHGQAGNDTLMGSEVGDFMEGEFGNDTLEGFGGDDALIGDDFNGPGDDTYIGGAGSDLVSYPPTVKSGVTVDLAKAGPQQTGEGNDSFSEVEGLFGTPFDDTIRGTNGPNVIKAGQGDDTVEGRGGDDLLSGGGGTDTLVYADAPAGVSVDLGAGTASGGDGKDSLGLNEDFDNVIGSQFADALIGGPGANQITGLGGVDVIRALGGPDRVDVRDGGPDNASCGSEIDTAISDRLSLDTVQSDCERIDALPEPPPPAGGAGGTGAGNTGGGGSKDTKVLFSLRGAKRQPLLTQRAVLVMVRCPQEACKVVTSAVGRVPAIGSAGVRVAKKLRTAPTRSSLGAGVTKTVKLHLGKRQLAMIGAALQIGKRPRLRVAATATDVDGNSAPAQLTVTAKP